MVGIGSSTEGLEYVACGFQLLKLGRAGIEYLC
jgi:hypothetical protein